MADNLSSKPFHSVTLHSGNYPDDGMPRMKVITDRGWLGFGFNPQHPENSPTKVKAVMDAIAGPYGNAGSNVDAYSYLATHKRLNKQLLEGAADTLVEHGFLAEASKDPFIRNTRQSLLRNHCAFQLDQFLNEVAAESVAAKPFIAVMSKLSETGDMATLPEASLRDMRAIANGDRATLRRTVPHDNWQAVFKNLCTDFKPEIEAAIRQHEAGTLETDADGKPLVKPATPRRITGGDSKRGR